MNVELVNLWRTVIMGVDKSWALTIIHDQDNRQVGQ